MKKKNVAIFASGSGSNARKIIEYFAGNQEVDIALVISNRNEAGVLDHAKEFGIPTLIIDKSYFFKSRAILAVLHSKNVDLLVLAGFLWLIPSYLIQTYVNKIINIHPSLLPKYGGKGMYGHHVHEAVKANQESESGMTIHFVNEKFDEGEPIFQGKCSIDPNDSASEIAKKVLQLEHRYYPEIIDKVLKI